MTCLVGPFFILFCPYRDCNQGKSKTKKKMVGFLDLGGEVVAQKLERKGRKAKAEQRHTPTWSAGCVGKMVWANLISYFPFNISMINQNAHDGKSLVGPTCLTLLPLPHPTSPSHCHPRQPNTSPFRHSHHIAWT